MRNHYLKHFPEHHECHLCRRTYTRKDNLNSHLKRDHFQSVKTPSSSSSSSFNSFKRLTKKLEEYQRNVDNGNSTGDVYATLKYVPDTLKTIKNSENSQTASIPIDLSLRPNSVPIRNSISSKFGIFPTLCNYFHT